MSLVTGGVFVYQRIHFMMIDGVNDPNWVDIKEIGPFWFSFMMVIFIALMLALLTSIIDVLLDRYVRKMRLGLALLIGFVVQSLVIGIVVRSGIEFVQHMLRLSVEHEIAAPRYELAVPMAVILIFMVMVARIFIEFDRKLGPGNLWKLMTGRFFRPTEVERIFMFIDMQSSTTIAERLGHLEFSRLLRDCFSDFSIVDKFDAEIYQYVGDEVVVSWSPRRGLNNRNFIKAFFSFCDLLEKRGDYYQEKYGVKPYFKAGTYWGPSVVTEVGEVKSEITYHGDTLNTAARIQGMCNQYNAQLLIPEQLYEEVKYCEEYNFEEMGCTALKGKENRINLYKVTPA